MAEKGKEKGLLSAESCCCYERYHILIEKKFFHLLFFTLQTAVGTQFFMFLVHSKVITNCLCEVALNWVIGSELQIWTDMSRKDSAIWNDHTHSFKLYLIRCSFCRDRESCREFLQKLIQIVFFLLWSINLMFVICNLFTNWSIIRKTSLITDWSCMGKLTFWNTICL